MASSSPDAARPALEPPSARGPGDRELLGRFVRARDEAAFAALVERHGPMVLAVCRRALGNASDAEDACQATFLALAGKAHSIRKAESLAGWLHGVACRVCANLERQRRRRHRRERAALPARPPEPPAEVSWREVRAALDEELRQLPERLRDPLILCYLEGLTRDEAARQLGLTPGCLHGRLERARRLLSGRLARRGFTLSAVLLASAFGAARAAPSPALVRSSARAAALLARRQQVPAALIPGHVLSLTREVVHGMFLTRLTLALSALACAALLLAAGGGVLTSADTAPDAKDPPPGDSAPAVAEGPLPAGAVRRLGSRRFRVAGRCGFALPAPDGKHLLVQANPSLSGYASHGLFLLDADTGLRVRSFEESRRVPKGGFLALAEAVRPAAFSPDGKTLYGLGWHKSEEAGDVADRVYGEFDRPCKRALLVWDVATGKLKAEYDLPPGEGLGSSLLGLAVSPDGKRLFIHGAIRFVGGPGMRNRGIPGLHVLDAATCEKLQTWEGAGHAVGLTADGKALITFRRGAPITAHAIESGKPVRTFPLVGFIPSAVLSPDGKTLAAVGIEGDGEERACTVKVWDAATGRPLHRLTPAAGAGGHPLDSRARLAFAADGRTLFVGADNGRILRWDRTGGRPLPDWPAHHGAMRELFTRPGKGELISVGSSDGAVRRWDPATGKGLSATDAYTGEISLARSTDGKRAATVDAAGRLDLWEVATGRIPRTFQTPGRGRHRLAFTPDGEQLLLAAETGPSTVWDLSAGKSAGELVPPGKKDPKAGDAYWGTLAFSPDGGLLVASRFYRGNWAWTWPERKVLWHEAGAFPVAPDWESSSFPDGERVAGGTWHGAIEVRDPRTGAVKRPLPGRGLTDVTYSPDRRRMVTAHLGGAWQVRDGTTGEVLKEVKPFQHAWCADFSPTGWLLAVSGDNSVRVHDTASWDEVARFDGHEGTVRAVFFGPDDATLVSASGEDGTALVWSLETPSREPPDPAKLWADLAGEGPAVRQAVWAAARHPDVAVALFRAKWPVPKDPPDAGRIRRLIADLDSPTFATREAAEAELAKVGRRAGPALGKELESTTSAEVRRRARKLLARWAPPPTAGYPAEAARELRAVWALELAGTPEARKLLREWVDAGVGDRLWEEAAAALGRSEGKE